MSVTATLKGRVGRDLQLKFTSANLAIASFSVVTHDRKIVNGEWTDVNTTWWECKAFGALAESLMDSVIRGSLVTITGAIKQSSYVNKEGEKRTVYEVLVDTCALQVVPAKYHGTKTKEKLVDPQQWNPKNEIETPF